MGGMTGIALASLFPDAVSRLAVTACTAKTTPVRHMPTAIPLAPHTKFDHLHLVLGLFRRGQRHDGVSNVELFWQIRRSWTVSTVLRTTNGQSQVCVWRGK